MKKLTNKRGNSDLLQISLHLSPKTPIFFDTNAHLCFSKHFFDGRLHFHLLFVQSSTEEMFSVAFMDSFC